MVYTLKSDITSRHGDFTPGKTNGHTFKAGGELMYNQSHSLSLTGAARRAMWVRLVNLRAGTAPQEDLRGLGISATHAGSPA